MMIFNQSKIVLTILLFANIITPMMRLPDVKGVFHDRSEHNNFAPVLMVENCMSLGVLAYQAALFVWLKKRHTLFGTELIPKKIDVTEILSPIVSKHLISGGAVFGLTVTAISSAANMLPQVCIYSRINTGINTLLLISSVLHISNLIHNNVLKYLKRGLKKTHPPELILKQTLDMTVLPDAHCLICLDDACTCGYVNLCNKQEHIFCKECVVTWFNEVRQRDNFVNKYTCELCRKDVPRNDEKFEIMLSPEPKVTLGLWFKQMGSLAIFYGLSLYVFMQIMQCQFS